jgi:hypothetical protein
MITCTCIRIKRSKWKNGFIEDDIMRYIDVTGGNIKVFKTFVHIAISKEYTMSGSELKFLRII